MYNWFKFLGAGWKPPELAGEPVVLQALMPSHPPICRSARWQGDVLEVQSAEAAVKSLFDVVLPDVEACLLLYRFEIQTENLKSKVYPQMWCRLPEKGLFFSKGVYRKVSGNNDWLLVEIPFFLQKGQVADLLLLELVFQGAGLVHLRNIEVTSTAVA
jgi:hypothetical protein